MHFHNRYDGVDQYALWLIQTKAKQLAGRYGFSPSDREDLEQELMLDLLQRLPRFDPSRAKRKTFINRVVDHAVASLVKRQKAEKRDYRRNGGSLSKDVEAPDGGLVERGNTLSADTGQAGRSDEAGCLLVFDVRTVILILPEDLRELTVRLRTQSVAQAARGMGVPRQILHERVKRLRCLFENAGLRNYL